MTCLRTLYSFLLIQRWGQDASKGRLPTNKVPRLRPMVQPHVHLETSPRSLNTEGLLFRFAFGCPSKPLCQRPGVQGRFQR